MDAELNIVSIIDCFTVIIIYLITAASFVSMGVLDSTVARAANGSGASALRDPSDSLTVVAEVKASNDIALNLLGGSRAQMVIASQNGKPDFERAVESLKHLKSNEPKLNKIALIAEPDVEYSNLASAAFSFGKVAQVILTAGESL